MKFIQAGRAALLATLMNLTLLMVFLVSSYMTGVTTSNLVFLALALTQVFAWGYVSKATAIVIAFEYFIFGLLLLLGISVDLPEERESFFRHWPSEIRWSIGAMLFLACSWAAASLLRKSDNGPDLN